LRGYSIFGSIKRLDVATLRGGYGEWKHLVVSGNRHHRVASTSRAS